MRPGLYHIILVVSLIPELIRVTMVGVVSIYMTPRYVTWLDVPLDIRLIGPRL
jgi:hypothetical protein